MENITDAEFKDVDSLSSEVNSTESSQVNEPMMNGVPVKQVRFLDYGDIRVVFDADTGQTLGVMPAKKVKVKKT